MFCLVFTPSIIFLALWQSHSLISCLFLRCWTLPECPFCLLFLAFLRDREHCILFTYLSHLFLFSFSAFLTCCTSILLIAVKLSSSCHCVADLHDRSVYISYFETGCRFQFGRALGGEGINTESSCCVPKYLLKSVSKEVCTKFTRVYQRGKEIKHVKKRSTLIFIIHILNEI